MSIALMTAVWKLDLPPSDKMVLLALADAANDDGVTWMAVKSRTEGKSDLLTKCSLSERAVQGAIKRLCEGGQLTRIDRPGKGVIWTVHPRSICAPQIMPPAENDTDPRSICGETVSNLPSEAKASSGTPLKRGARFVPDRWEPSPSHFEKSQTLGLDLHEQAAAFRDYEFAKPILDFDRAFHRWLRNARKFENAKPDKLTARHENYAASWSGADGAAELLASRRAF